MKFDPVKLKMVMRKEKIKTHQELADKLKVTRPLVTDILAGKREPGTKFLFGMIRAFPGYNWEYFYIKNEEEEI